MLSSLAKHFKKRRKQRNSKLLLISRDVGDTMSTKSEILSEWNDVIAESSPYDGAGFDWSPVSSPEGLVGPVDLVETGQNMSGEFETPGSSLIDGIGSDLFHNVESRELSRGDDESNLVLTEDRPLGSAVRGDETEQQLLHSDHSAHRLSEACLEDLDPGFLGSADSTKRKECIVPPTDEANNGEDTLPDAGGVKETDKDAARKKKKKKSSFVEYDFASGLSSQASQKKKKKKRSSTRKPPTEEYSFGGCGVAAQPKQEQKVDSVVASAGGRKPATAQYSFVTSIDDVQDSDAPAEGDHTDKFTFI